MKGFLVYNIDLTNILNFPEAEYNKKPKIVVEPILQIIYNKWILCAFLFIWVLQSSYQKYDVLKPYN